MMGSGGRKNKAKIDKMGILNFDFKVENATNKKAEGKIFWLHRIETFSEEFVDSLALK